MLPNKRIGKIKWPNRIVDSPHGRNLTLRLMFWQKAQAESWKFKPNVIGVPRARSCFGGESTKSRLRSNRNGKKVSLSSHIRNCAAIASKFPGGETGQSPPARYCYPRK